MIKSTGIISAFAQHKVAANLFMAIMILSGVWGILQLNTQFFPNLSLSFATVRMEWSGASAEDVEVAITKPLEQELITLEHLKKLSSTSVLGMSSITLEFEENSDMGAALDEINERIARVRNLPIDAEDPEVTRIVNYELIARLVISGEASLAEIRQLSYDIKDELIDRGIAKIDIIGLPDEEIAIEISSAQLKSLGLSLEDIANKIRQQSKDVPAGLIGQDDVSQQLRGLEQKHNIDEFANLPILVDDRGNYLVLGDIANIERRAKRNEVHVFKNQRPAVELILNRTEDSDSFESAKILESWFTEQRPLLPKTINIDLYDQQWQLIKERVMLLLTNGIGGLILITLIVYLFLNGRIAFWVAWGIPVSFMATLGLLYVAGGSINMISLFGIIMALGIIVDDAIVVAENAQANFEQGDNASDAAIKGAHRMFFPVLASSLTTIAAFFPLMLINGPIGQILFHIPLVVICVVIASFIECMWVLPHHTRGALNKFKDQKIKEGRFDRYFNYFRDHQFKRFVTFAIKYRFSTVAAAFALLIISIGLIAGGRISFTFFPGVDGTILLANASFTAGTPKERVKTFLNQIDVALKETEQFYNEKLVKTAVFRLGESRSGNITGRRRGEQYGSLIVELISPDSRDVTNAEFIQTWESYIEQPPGIEMFVITQRVGGPPGQDIDIQLSGGSAERLKQAAIQLNKKLSTFPGVSAIEDDLPWGQEQLIYTLTPQGQSLGINIQQAGKQLRDAFEGARVQRFQDGDDEVDVLVMLSSIERNQLSTLAKMHYVFPDGDSIPLDTIVTFKNKQGFEALRHLDSKLSVRVSADVDRTVNNANRILASLEEEFIPALIEQYNLSYSLEGRAGDQAETMTDMTRGALFALIMIYIILAWVSSSYLKPVVILMAIPFGLIGAILGHLIMGIEFTLLSIFGIIGLSGIVVNDSIILLDFHQKLIKAGHRPIDAILEASCARLRAVLLTSLTTIAGLTPLLFETSMQAQFLIPMATSITFGLAFSTVLVLIVIPAMLAIMEQIKTGLKHHATKMI